MGGMELASFAASIAAVVLAIVAIWLSVVFYRISSQLSESTKEAAKGIGSSVEKLEKLFDKLYSDTFSMMRDTVSDMRKHIWPEDTHTDDEAAEEAEIKAEQKVQSLKDEVQKQFSEILNRQQITDERLSGMTHEFSSLVDKVISQSRKVEIEAREETIREHVLEVLKVLSRKHRKATANDLVVELRGTFPVSKIIGEIKRMKVEGILIYEAEVIGADTVITLP